VTEQTCRWCRQPVTFYLKSWWGEDDNTNCPESDGEHLPFLVTVLPAVEAWNTIPPQDPKRHEVKAIVPGSGKVKRHPKVRRR